MIPDAGRLSRDRVTVRGARGGAALAAVPWARLGRDAYAIASAMFIVAILAGVVGQGVDGRAYWVNRLPDPYASAVYGELGGYYYSPAFAQVVAPLTLLPWPAFHALLISAALASLWWLVGPWALPALLLPPVAIEIYAANITLPLAVVMVAGLRHPAAWAFPLLTKIMPGIGVLWFAVRGEWRSLAVAIAATAFVAAVSYALAPRLWAEWAVILRSSAGQPIPPNAVAVPLMARLPFALAAVIVGARTDRAWLIPVAAVLATPVIWPATVALLLAVPRLRLADRAVSHLATGRACAAADVRRGVDVCHLERVPGHPGEVVGRQDGGLERVPGHA